MTKDQKIVAVGATSGIATMALSVAALYALWPVNADLSDLSSRLAYTAVADLFAAIPLFAGVIYVANNRFFTEAIDPTLQKEDRTTLINGRVLDNTVQQYLLLLIATLALSVGLTAEQMRVIPAAASVFIAARFAFWIGYRIKPVYRAFGMAATIYLNLGLLSFAAWRAMA